MVPAYLRAVHLFVCGYGSEWTHIYYLLEAIVSTEGFVLDASSGWPADVSMMEASIEQGGDTASDRQEIMNVLEYF